MARQYSIQIVSQTEEDGRALRAMLEPGGYVINERLASGDFIVDTEDPGVDLYVVSLPESFSPSRQEGNSTGRVPRKRVLYTTPNAADSLRRELFRAGAAGVLTRPFDALDLLYRADQLLASDWNRFRREFDEDAMLELVKTLVDSRIETIEPALEPNHPTGHFYPAIATVLGRTALDHECLEKLASLGLLGREIVNRIRLCPECDDNRINYREVCPKCASINVLQQEMITHFACAYSAPIQDFRRGADLLCPKCNEMLRHIGVDYEKPSQLFRCLDCSFVFRDPTVETQCLR